MALNWEAISNNIINISQVLGDFLDSKNAKQVEWIYMDEDGSVKNIKLPNLGSAIKQLQDTAITPDELSKELKNYYKSVEVDAIKAAINKTIDDHVNDLQGKINSLNKKVDSNFNTLETSISNTNKKIDKEINDVNKQAENLSKRVKALNNSDLIQKIGNNVRYPVGVVDTIYLQREDGGFLVSSLQKKAIIARRPGMASDEEVIGYLTTEHNGDNYELLSYAGQLAVRPSTMKYKYLTGTGPDLIVIKNTKDTDKELKKDNLVLIDDTSREWVINGSFDKDSDGWYARNGHGTLSYLSDKKAVKIKGSNLIPILETKTNIKLIPGAEYEIRIKASNRIQQVWLRSEEDYNITPIVFEDKDRNISTNRQIQSGQYVINYDESTDEYYVRIISKPEKAAPNRLLIGGVYDKNGEIVIENVTIKLVDKVIARVKADISKGIDIVNHVHKLAATDGLSNHKFMYTEGFWHDVDKTGFIFPFGVVDYLHNADAILNRPSGISKVDFEGWESFVGYGEVINYIPEGWKVSNLTEEQLDNVISFKFNNLRYHNGKLQQFIQRVRIISMPVSAYLATSQLGNNGDLASFTPKGLITGIVKNVRTSSVFYVTLETPNGEEVNLTQIQNQVYSILIKKQDGSVTIVNIRNINYNGNELILNKDIDIEVGDEAIVLLMRPYLGATGSGVGIPLAEFVQMNKGVYHPVFNPEGTAAIYYSGEIKKWYEVDENYISSIEDCFNTDLIAGFDGNGNIVAVSNKDTVSRSGQKRTKVTHSKYGVYYDALGVMSIRDLRPISGDITTTTIRNIVNKLTNGESIGGGYMPYFRKVLEVKKAGKTNDRVASTIISKKLTYTSIIGSYNNNAITEDFNSIRDSAFSRTYSIGTVLIKNKGNNKVNAFTQLSSPDSQRYHIHGSYKGTWYTYGASYINEMGRSVHIDNSEKVVEISGVVNRDTKTFNYDVIPFIYGDPRSIRERIEADATKGKDENIDVFEGTCIAVDKNKVYRSLIYRGVVNINPDKENYTDTNKWKELCNYSDIDKGGYPEVWKKVGVDGIPVLNTLQDTQLPYLKHNRFGQGFVLKGLFPTSITNDSNITVEALAYNSLTKEWKKIPGVVDYDSLKNGNKVGHYIDNNKGYIYINPVLSNDYDAKIDDYWVFMFYIKTPHSMATGGNINTNIVIADEKVYNFTGTRLRYGANLLSSTSGLNQNTNKIKAMFHLGDYFGAALLINFVGYTSSPIAFYNNSAVIRRVDGNSKLCLIGTKVMYAPITGLLHNDI